MRSILSLLAGIALGAYIAGQIPAPETPLPLAQPGARTAKVQTLTGAPTVPPKPQKPPPIAPGTTAKLKVESIPVKQAEKAVYDDYGECYRRAVAERAGLVVWISGSGRTVSKREAGLPGVHCHLAELAGQRDGIVIGKPDGNGGFDMVRLPADATDAQIIEACQQVRVVPQVPLAAALITRYRSCSPRG